MKYTDKFKSDLSKLETDSSELEEKVKAAKEDRSGTNPLTVSKR